MPFHGDSPAVTPALTVMRRRLRVLLVDPDPVRRAELQGWLVEQYEVHAVGDATHALPVAVDLIPSVLVADVSTVNLACLIERLLEELALFEIGVMLLMDADARIPPDWAEYTLLRRPFGREQMLTCLVTAATPHRALASTLRRERQRREEAETLLDLALDLTSRLDLKQLLQRATDAATELTGAAFGAFFYNSVDEVGQKYLLYTLSGAPLKAFERFGTPRNTPLFAPTFAGERIVRSDDVRQESLYGTMEPHRGMPKGHLPVRSYLAVPVISRGEVLGGMFFGHPEPAMFSQRSERVAAAIAAQAAVAIDNSRLFSAMRERQLRESDEQPAQQRK
jgi:CheY-like chemotaxis protein